MHLSEDEIIYILTLRYIPKKQLKSRLWPDFSEWNLSKQHCIQKTEELLRETLSKYANFNRIGVLVSGGIDSTLILAILKKLNPNLDVKTFSMGFGQDADELNDSKIISELYETDHTEIIVKDFIKQLPLIIWKTRMPKWNLYPYYLYNTASKKVDYILSGEGGDELFGGYAFRYEEILKTAPKTVEEKIMLYLNTHKRDWVPDQENLFGTKIKFSWEKIYKVLYKYFDNNLPILGQVFLADYYGKLLNDFIPVDIACAKAAGVKIASPILTNKIINFASHIPYNYKFDRKTKRGKLILRMLLKSYNVPKKILNKPKMGFGMDTIEYWKCFGREHFESLFEDSRLIEDGWISADWVKKHLYTNNLNGQVRYVNKFLGLIALEVYYRLFITKEMKPTEAL
jgi:asparagine synthase (glutamine-hydrolysing)